MRCHDEQPVGWHADAHAVEQEIAHRDEGALELAAPDAEDAAKAHGQREEQVDELIRLALQERQVRQMCDSEDHVEDAEERPCHQKGEHSADEPGQHGLDGAEPRHADVPDGVEDDRHEDGRQREHADEQPLLRAPRQHVVILCFCHIQSSNVAGRAIA